MNTQDITNAKDPDLRASMTALRRASALARETAFQTNTAVVIIENGKLVRVSAEELRRKLSPSAEETKGSISDI